MNADKANPRTVIGVIGLGCVIFFAIFLIPSFVTVVEAGEVGVYSLFGNVSDEPLQPGINFKVPFAQIIKMPTRTQSYTMTSGDEDTVVDNNVVRSSDDAIEARAKDGARIWLDITVLFHLESEKAPNIYKELGLEYAEKIVRPQIRSSIRGVLANYTVTEIYSTKREEIQQTLLAEMTKTLADRGFEMEEVLLRKVNLSQTLSQSIEDKLAAQQEAEKYDFVLDKEKKEADRKRIEAAGQRDAQKTISQGLTTNYLFYLYIQNLKDSEGTIYVPVNPENGLPLFKGVN